MRDKLRDLIEWIQKHFAVFLVAVLLATLTSIYTMHQNTSNVNKNTENVNSLSISVTAIEGTVAHLESIVGELEGEADPVLEGLACAFSLAYVERETMQQFIAAVPDENDRFQIACPRASVGLNEVERRVRDYVDTNA